MSAESFPWAPRGWLRVQPGPPPAEHIVPNNKRQAGSQSAGRRPRKAVGEDHLGLRRIWAGSVHLPTLSPAAAAGPDL